MICSNDRYTDHCDGTPGSGGKDLRRWLRHNRTGYEFRVGSVEEAAYVAGRELPISVPPVGSVYLPPPPDSETTTTTTTSHDVDGSDAVQRGPEGSSSNWVAEVHAVGSSRPWGLGQRWGKDGGRGRKKRRRRGVGGGARRERSVSDSEPDFPFWALPDDHLPVEFALKKSVKFVG